MEITKLGNPFKGEVDKKELVQLGTKDVMGEDAVKTVMGIEELGKKSLERSNTKSSKNRESMNRKFHSTHQLRRTRLQSSDHHLLTH